MCLKLNEIDQITISTIIVTIQNLGEPDSAFHPQSLDRGLHPDHSILGLFVASQHHFVNSSLLPFAIFTVSLPLQPLTLSS